MPVLGKAILAAAVLASSALVVSVAPAVADGLDTGYSWEDAGGLLVDGQVEFSPADPDQGRHAQQGYQRFYRTGDGFDTGRLYTAAASSKTSRALYTRFDQETDSLHGGAAYVTHYNYGFLWFQSGGGGTCGVTPAGLSPDTVIC